MALARNGALAFSILTALASAACTAHEETESQELMQVSSLSCSVSRGAFVARSSLSPEGDLSVTCPAGSNVTFNGTAVANGSAFQVKPRNGINILHVERLGETLEVTDIPFLFGNFKDARSTTPNAVAVRVGAKGLSNGGTMTLPLPAGPTPVNVSQIASQYLRDQGNLLARLDGTRKDVSAGPFSANVQLIRSSYDDKDVTVVVTPRDRGVHIDAVISDVQALLRWEAGVAGLDLDDNLTASIGKLAVSADIDFTFDAASKRIKGTLRNPDLHVDGLDIDSVALSHIPFGLGDGLEDAIAGGAQALLNRFADPLLESLSSKLVPNLAVSLEQLKLPANLPIPFLGGSVDLKQSFDGATFLPNGVAISAAAGVSAPGNKAILSGPGFFSVPSLAPTFDPNASYGASLSLDYVNQALYAVWQQGLLKRQISGPVSAFGISTEAIHADAKLPPVVLVSADGKGIDLNLGQFEIDTTFHSTTAGDAKVKVAVTLIAGANLELADEGATLHIKPSGDEARTKLVAELIGVPAGKPGAAEELAQILTMFTPVIEAMVAHDLELPPVAIPAIDLGIITPGFAARQGRFDGQIQFDAPAARVNVQGKIVAH